MGNHIHLLIATTISIFITFILDCVLQQTRANSSFIQHYFADQLHDFLFAIRCWFEGQHNFMHCHKLLIDRNDDKVLWSAIVVYAYTVIVAFYARYCEDQNLCSHVDVFTVYFLMWQWIYVMSKWEDHGLSCPFLILQQASLCVSMSFTGFLFYDFVYRYVPIQVNFTLLWLWALYDIFICLYIHGRLRKMFLNTSSENPSSELYYPYDFEDEQIYNYDLNDIISDVTQTCNINIDIDNIDNCNIDTNVLIKIIPAILRIVDKYGYASLGLGDFFCFNMMSLLIMNPLWTTSIKLCVLFGCIVSIQIGHCIMRIVQFCWEESCMPTVPFCVITFSMYAAIIHPIIDYATTKNIDIQTCI